MRSGTSASGTRNIRIGSACRGPRAPECIEPDDIMEFTLDGTAIDAARPQALRRAVHPRCRLRGAPRRQSGHSQSQPDADSLRDHRRAAPACHAHVRVDGCRYPGLGLANELRRHEPPRDLHADGPGSRGRARRSSCRADARARVRRRRRLAARGRLQCDLPAVERGSAAQVVGVGRDHLPERWRDRGGDADAEHVHLRARVGGTWCQRAGRAYDVRPMEGPLAGV